MPPAWVLGYTGRVMTARGIFEPQTELVFRIAGPHPPRETVHGVVLRVEPHERPGWSTVVVAAEGSDEPILLQPVFGDGSDYTPGQLVSFTVLVTFS